MGDCCNCNSEISRDGSGQLSRYLKALDPGYALVDDRSIEDLLVFAKRYANQIRFYDIHGSEIPGDADKTKISWREFFRRDIAVIAASIALTDTTQIKKDYDELRAKLDEHPTYNVFGDLFDPLLGMVAKIDGWYSLAIPENPLYADLQLAINSNLKTQLQTIKAYEEGFKYIDTKHLLNLDYSSIKNKDVWGLNDTVNADISIYQGTDSEDKIRNVALYVDDIFNSFYGFINQLIKNSESYMQFALEQYPAHQPHMALFISFLELFRLAQEQVNGITQRMLDFYYSDVLHLTAKPSIPDKVHIVFELAKDVAEYDVAQGTQLKAGKDASGKDQLYATENDLVVNQAKVKEIKNIFIDTSLFSETQADGTSINKNIINNIYARPVANSPDGLGEPFSIPNSKWQTFGKGNAVATSNNLCDQIALIDDADRKDQAQVGFAIASPQLLLQGGNRLLKITLGLNNDNLFPKAKDFEIKNPGKSFFNISLTGEKGWLEIKKIIPQSDWNKLLVIYTSNGQSKTTGIFNPEINYTAGAYFLDAVNHTIVVYLPLPEQAIIAFDAKLHTGYDYKTIQPVIKIALNAEAGLPDSDFESFAFKPSAESILINTKVGSVNPSKDELDEIEKSPEKDKLFKLINFHFDGLKKLVLQNKDGLITAGKTFDPFTAYPLRGRSFYIGSDEIFNKVFNKTVDTNDAIAINLEKTIDIGNLPDESDDNGNDTGVIGLKMATLSTRSFNAETYAVKILSKKIFIPVTQIIADGADRISFSRPELTTNILASSSGLSFNREPILPVTEWKPDIEKGFISLDLFSTTRKGLNDAALENVSALQASQNLAPLIEVKDVSVSYDSTLQLKMGIDQFYHIYPFGVVETYLDLSANGNILTNANTNASTITFADLDKQKEGLLVNARNALFPQFDYISPYARFYNSARSFQSVPKTFGLAENNMQLISTRINANKNIGASLMLNERKSITSSTNQYTGDIQQGLLYIGLEKLQPLQSISMLFQFAEGSAANEDDEPPTINWSYLSYNEWKPLKAENIVFDGTYGFQTTGIIKMDIPADASTHNTIITDGLLWLQASVLKNADRIPQLIDIVTQAAEAVFSDNSNDPSHFDDALPAASISKLAVPMAQVSKVQQPFSSFDGRHKEIGKEFYTRVSERLRHKARAITAWDYEHLVLDRFPSIYKVKCITHIDPDCLCTNKLVKGGENVLPARVKLNVGDLASLRNTLSIVDELLHNNPLIDITLIGYGQNADMRIKQVYNTLVNQSTEIIIPALTYTIDPRRIHSRVETVAPNNPDPTIEVVDIIQTEACCGPQVAPGHVLIVPVANLKNRNAADPLQPKTSRRTLIAIEDYLKKRTSPFVHVHAKNAVYEQIIVAFKVKFYSGIDKGFYMKKLNEEIVQFLTPWAFAENAEVKFNQKIYASSIINFIEERSYIDFITDFIMGVCCNDCCPPSASTGNGTITGKVYDNNSDNKLPLPNIVIKIKELNLTSSGNAAGNYTIENIPAGNYTLVAYFSLFNVQKQSFTVDPRGKVTQNETEVTSIDFYKGEGNRQDDVNNFFASVCGCEGVEWLLKDDPNFEGDIVAKPCTSRSLLVSVPQHIIIPYEEDPKLSPCEQRKNQTPVFTPRTFAGASLAVNKNIIKGKKQPVLTETKTATVKAKEKIVTEKKATVDATKKTKAATIKQPKKKP